MAGKESIHPFNEQMLNDCLLFKYMEIEQWIKQSPCFHRAYNQIYWVGVEAWREGTVDREHTYTLVGDKC